MRGLLFAFVLLVALSFAIPQVSIPSLDLVENPAFIIAVALLSISFVALSYAVSYSIQNPSAIAWSKEQLREVIVGIIIVVIVYGADVTANNLIHGMTGHADAMAMGDASLRLMMDDLEMVYSKIGEAYFSVAVQQGTTVSVTWGMPPLKFSFWQPTIYYTVDYMPYFGMGSILQTLSMASQNIMTQYLSFKVVQILLSYAGAVVPHFLLPIGFAFRIFPFTRKAGNTLIALSLGAIFMLPASLIVVGELRNGAHMANVDAVRTMNFEENLDPGFFSSANFMKEGFCENTAMRVITGFGEIFWGIIFALIASAPTLFATFYTWFEFFGTAIWPWVVWIIQILSAAAITGMMETTDSGAIYDQTIQPIVHYLLPASMEVTMFSIIAVIFIAMVTYTGTKSISVALGGEYAFYGLTRLI